MERRRHPLLIAVTGACLAACGTVVDPTNAFDPDAPAALQEPASLHGLVQGAPSPEAEAVPVVGATVSLQGAGEPRTALTDPDGAFSFEALTPGDYQLEVAHPSYFRQVRQLGLLPGEALESRVTLDGIPQQLGSEVGHLTGEALKSGELTRPAAEQDHSGVLVELTGAGIRTVTNAAGRFDLYVAPGHYDVTFSAPDYSPASRDAVEIPAGETVELPGGVVSLEANPGVVTGQILLEGVGPAGNADAIVSIPGGATTTTAPDGTFRLAGVAGGDYVLGASREGFDSASMPGVHVDGGRESALPPIRLQLSRGQVRGTVALLGRTDASGVTLGLTGTAFTAVSAASGEFLITGVPVSTYELTARKDGFSVGVVGGVAVTASGTTLLEPITLVGRRGDFDIDGGAPFTNQPSVTLTLRSADAARMRISEDPTFTDAAAGEMAFRDFEPSPTFALSAGDGPKTIYVAYLDALGVESGPFQGTITLDTTPPVLHGFTIEGGATFSSEATGLVELQLLADDVGSGVAALRLSDDGLLDTELFEPFVTRKVHQLADGSGEGLRTVLVELRDAAGNVTALPGSATITLDHLPPTLTSFEIEGGAPFVASPLVQLAIAATGATRMALANDPNAARIFEPFASPHAWFLSTADGQKTVYLSLMDEAGNSNVVPFEAQTVLDTTPPSGVSLSIHGTVADGAASTALTGTALVDLDVGGIDAGGISGMWLSESPGFVGALFEPFVVAHPFTLSAGDGPKQLHLMLQDAAGNLATTSATITLDTTAPSLASVTITAGDFTQTRNVDLLLSAAGATELRVDGDVTGAGTAAWIPYAESLALQLTAGDCAAPGCKVVRVSYRDAAGNASAQVSDQTTLDAAPPTANGLAITGTIGGASSSTLSGSAAVSLSPSSTGATGMLLSNSAGFVGATWQPFDAGPIPWVLVPGDGVKTVHAKYRDAAGNESAPVSAGLTLDTLPPGSPTVLLADGGAFSGLATVPVSLGAIDAVQMRLSTDGLFDTEPFVPYATGTTVTFAAPDGLKTVYVLFRDEAGNDSVVVNDSITLDTMPPVALPATAIAISGITVVGAERYTRSPSVTLSLRAGGADEMAISTDGVFDSESYSSYADTAVALLPGGDCAVLHCKQACVRFRDLAGNTTGSFCDTVTLDTTPPSTPLIVTPPQTVDAPSLAISIAAPVTEPFFARYELAGGPQSFPAGFVSASTNRLDVTFTAPLDQGSSGGSVGGYAQNTLRLRAVDRAGNVSGESAVVVGEDSVAPATPLLLSAPSVVNADTFDLYLDPAFARDATFTTYLTRRCANGSCTPFAPTPLTDGLVFTLVQGDGSACGGQVPCVNSLEVEARDAAGHASGAATVAISEDSVPPSPPSLTPRDVTVHAADVRMRALIPSTDALFSFYELQGGLSYPNYTRSAQSDFFSFALRPDEANQLCVRGVDQAGNRGIADCVTVRDRSSIQLTATSAEETDADVLGDLIVWQGQVDCGPGLSSREIMLRDLRTGATSYLSTICDGVDASSPRFGTQHPDAWIVFEEGGHIFRETTPLNGVGPSTLLDLTAGHPTAGSSSLPDTDGTNVMWVSGGQIYTRDGNGTRALVAGSSLCAGQRPRIARSRVVWCQDDAGNRDVWRHYINAGTTDAIATGPAQQSDPVSDGSSIFWIDDGVLTRMDVGGAVGSATSVTDVLGVPIAPTELTDASGGFVVYTVRALGNDKVWAYDIYGGGTAVQLTSAAANQRRPSIMLGRVVWQDSRNLDSDIYVQDLSETKFLAVHPARQTQPLIDDDRIAWTDQRTGDYTVAGSYDLADDVESLPAGTDGATVAAVGGSKIAWFALDGWGAGHVYTRDVTTGTTLDVTSSATLDAQVALTSNGNAIVYQRDVAGVAQLYRRILSPLGAEVALTAGGGAKSSPDIDVNIIVWQEAGQLYCRDSFTGQGGLVLAGGLPVTATHPRISGDNQVVYERGDDIDFCELYCSGAAPSCARTTTMAGGPATQRNPDISGNGVVWESDERSPGYFDIIFGDIRSGASLNLTQDTPVTVNQVNPSISGRRVVWEDYRLGNPDLFLYEAPR